eukprot:scaffold172209_cov20-Prasinocladus_malaysianus.AAC.1
MAALHRQVSARPGEEVHEITSEITSSRCHDTGVLSIPLNPAELPFNCWSSGNHSRRGNALPYKGLVFCEAVWGMMRPLGQSAGRKVSGGGG